MTTTIRFAVATNVARSSAPRPEPGVHALAGEHAVLLRDVRRRTAPVLALADARIWPAAELRTLIGFLRTAVLGQVGDAEGLLDPGDQNMAPSAELSLGHRRLHALTQQLAQASAKPCPLPVLTALIEDLLATLQQHLLREQAVLVPLPGAPKQVPATAALTSGNLMRTRPAETALIVLDTLPAERAVQLSIERLLRMRPGETAEVRSSNENDLRQVWDWMRCYDTVGYGFSHTQAGPQQWRLQITRRRAT